MLLFWNKAYEFLADLVSMKNKIRVAVVLYVAVIN